jgi:hypothetical protein
LVEQLTLNQRVVGSNPTSPTNPFSIITLRMGLIKIAARIAGTARRVRIAFAADHPEAALFASLARCIHPAGLNKTG